MGQEGFLLPTNPVPISSPTRSGDEVCAFEIVFGESEPIGFELSESFLAYILKTAVCTRCLEIIADAAHLKTCDRPTKSDSDWSTTRYRYCFITSPDNPEFRERWGRERQRFREHVRKYKLRKIPLPSEELLAELRRQQGNRCYYCFVELANFSRVTQPQVDHFKSVALRGTNSIFNLVYACATCNREKFKENGDEFINRRFPERAIPAEILGEIKRMRDSVAEWKKQFAPRNLATVERLVSEHALSIPDQDSIEFHEWCKEGLGLFQRLEQIKCEKVNVTKTLKGRTL